MDAANLFAEQVSVNMLVQNVVYASGTVGAIFVVIGLLLVDAGGIRRKNRFNAVVEKIVGFFISFATYFLIGFGAFSLLLLNDWFASGFRLGAIARWGAKVDGDRPSRL